MRKEKFLITVDHDFDQVIDQCARTRKEGTWITAEMMDAYRQLHRMGYAHSVETWYEARLVGGLYGVSLGLCFFGESMFSTMNDASKVALVHLAHHLGKRHYSLIDCQMPTEHLLRMGARTIARDGFLLQLKQALNYPSRIGRWNLKESSIEG